MRRQHHIYRLCYPLLALLIAPQGFAEERNDGAFSAIEREMSAEERRATGIDSLSTYELDALNQWLIERFDQVQETVSAEVREEVREEVLEEVREADAAEREAEIERRVAIEVEAAKQEIADAPSEPAVNEPFEATIQGRFSGWSGKTVFPLDNGQVWRQRHGGRYRHTDEDQRVRIYKNLLGMWQMKVLSSGRSVPVRQID
tara:strand:+ start:761 stop:1366 length:606 start_codon:yes stop_codon:yes gene_type:complete